MTGKRVPHRMAFQRAPRKRHRTAYLQRPLLTHSGYTVFTTLPPLLLRGIPIALIFTLPIKCTPAHTGLSWECGGDTLLRLGSPPPALAGSPGKKRSPQAGASPRPAPSLPISPPRSILLIYCSRYLCKLTRPSPIPLPPLQTLQTQGFAFIPKPQGNSCLPLHHIRQGSREGLRVRSAEEPRRKGNPRGVKQKGGLGKDHSRQ